MAAFQAVGPQSVPIAHEKGAKSHIKYPPIRQVKPLVNPLHKIKWKIPPPSHHPLLIPIFLQPHLGVPIELIAARVEERSQLYSLQVVAKELHVQRRQAEPEVCAERSVGRGLIGMVPARALEIGHKETLRVVVEPPAADGGQPGWAEPRHLPVNDTCDCTSGGVDEDIEVAQIAVREVEPIVVGGRHL